MYRFSMGPLPPLMSTARIVVIVLVLVDGRAWVRYRGLLDTPDVVVVLVAEKVPDVLKDALRLYGCAELC